MCCDDNFGIIIKIPFIKAHLSYYKVYFAVSKYK